jgi:hypothetical protein
MLVCMGESEDDEPAKVRSVIRGAGNSESIILERVVKHMAERGRTPQIPHPGRG